MKLRLAAQALRLRILRSELAALEAGGSLQESVRLAPGALGSITYSLAVAGQEQNSEVQVVCVCGDVRVTVSRKVFARWCMPEENGIYVRVDTGTGEPLKVVIEKDFACLDSSDADNRDTFEHPHAGAVC